VETSLLPCSAHMTARSNAWLARATSARPAGAVATLVMWEQASSTSFPLKCRVCRCPQLGEGSDRPGISDPSEPVLVVAWAAFQLKRRTSVPSQKYLSIRLDLWHEGACREDTPP
jgi:hypothetical protein